MPHEDIEQDIRASYKTIGEVGGCMGCSLRFGKVWEIKIGQLIIRLCSSCVLRLKQVIQTER